MKQFLFFGLVILFCNSCIQIPNTYTQLPPGKWRGVLKLTEPGQVQSAGVYDEDNKVSDYFPLPFNLEVEYVGEEMKVYLLNGTEKIEIEDTHLGRDLGTAKDTLRMQMTSYDTYMDGFYEENYIEGYWVVNYKDNYMIPYIITYGQDYRFIQNPVADTKNFDGQWKVLFDYDKEDPYPAIAEFQQKDNQLSGTFLTETGDYRYLEGNAFGDKLRLSVFDGSHAFLFSGSMDKDTIYGEFRSGKHYLSKWYAVRDDNFSLRDPNAMTQATKAQAINFSFPDPSGALVSLEDNRYDDKVKLVSIMGTWCPNCMDETQYLKTLLADPQFSGIEIISIAFERYKDKDKSMSIISNYKKNQGFSWPILLGGYASKKETGETFDFLDKIYSYPTLLLIDKQNKIRHIHTGFSGPATSKFEAFKKDMAAKISELLAE